MAAVAPAPAVGSFDRHVAIFFGSETCDACLLPTLDQRVRVILDSLRDDADVRKLRFTTVGVALDGPPANAVRWLRRYGAFDEVSVGGNWFNTAAQRFIWSEPTVKAGLPQIVLVRQHIVTDSARVVIADNVIVHTWFGAAAIAPALRREAVGRRE